MAKGVVSSWHPLTIAGSWGNWNFTLPEIPGTHTLLPGPFLHPYSLPQWPRQPSSWNDTPISASSPDLSSSSYLDVLPAPGTSPPHCDYPTLPFFLGPWLQKNTTPRGQEAGGSCNTPMFPVSHKGYPHYSWTDLLFTSATVATRSGLDLQQPSARPPV